MSGPSRATLLVPVDEFHASLALVRGLAAAGYAPVAAVSRRPTYAARSGAVRAVVQVPSAEDRPDDFAQAIAAAALRAGAAAILPGTEASLLALARHPNGIATRVAAPGLAEVELATDKARVLALAAECGLPGPQVTIAAPEELAAQADAFAYPAVVKPCRTRLPLDDRRQAYFKARRVDSSGDLRTHLRVLPPAPWMVQPYVEGRLCAVAGVAHEGALVCAVHQESLRIWPEKIGYSCYAQTVPADVELEGRVGELLAQLRWSGIFQLQMLRQGDGSRLSIDFNPRAYGSLSLAVRAGANLPGVWAALALGDVVPAPTYRPGVRYRLETGDTKAILTRLRTGRLVEAARAARPHRDTVHAIASLRDPAPMSLWPSKGLRMLARAVHDR